MTLGVGTTNFVGEGYRGFPQRSNLGPFFKWSGEEGSTECGIGGYRNVLGC
jgi:hypothetical protein